MIFISTRHVFYFDPHLYFVFVYPPHIVGPTFPLPRFERTRQSWLHVCGRCHNLLVPIELTDTSNRDGRNLTVHSLVEAMQRVYHFTKPLAYLLALAGVFFCGNGRTVDLGRLAKHNVIEHDASLSRQDTQPPHDHSPTDADLNLVAQLMWMSPKNFLVLNDLAAARVIRESQAVGGPLGPLHAEIARAESGLILQVFGDEKLEVDKDILYAWLVDGRLPGCWKSPKRMIGIHTTASVGRQIANVVDSIRNTERGRLPQLGLCHLALHTLSRELRFSTFGFIL